MGLPKKVRSLFITARSTTPSIIFLDELDALVGKRAIGSGKGGDSVQERVLSALLNEMDGVESCEGVLIMVSSYRIY